MQPIPLARSIESISLSNLYAPQTAPFHNCPFHPASGLSHRPAERRPRRPVPPKFDPGGDSRPRRTVQGSHDPRRSSKGPLSFAPPAFQQSPCERPPSLYSIRFHPLNRPRRSFPSTIRNGAWMNQHFYVRQGVGFDEMNLTQRDAAFGLLKAS